MNTSGGGTSVVATNQTKEKQEVELMMKRQKNQEYTERFVKLQNSYTQKSEQMTKSNQQKQIIMNSYYKAQASSPYKQRNNQRILISHEQSDQLFANNTKSSNSRLSGTNPLNPTTQPECLFTRSKVGLLNGSGQSATSTLIAADQYRNISKVSNLTATNGVPLNHDNNNINVYHQAVDMYSAMKGREQPKSGLHSNSGKNVHHGNGSIPIFIQRNQQRLGLQQHYTAGGRQLTTQKLSNQEVATITNRDISGNSCRLPSIQSQKDEDVARHGNLHGVNIASPLLERKTPTNLHTTKLSNLDQHTSNFSEYQQYSKQGPQLMIGSIAEQKRLLPTSGNHDFASQHSLQQKGAKSSHQQTVTTYNGLALSSSSTFKKSNPNFEIQKRAHSGRKPSQCGGAPSNANNWISVQGTHQGGGSATQSKRIKPAKMGGLRQVPNISKNTSNSIHIEYASDQSGVYEIGLSAKKISSQDSVQAIKQRQFVPSKVLKSTGKPFTQNLTASMKQHSATVGQGPSTNVALANFATVNKTQDAVRMHHTAKIDSSPPILTTNRPKLDNSSQANHAKSNKAHLADMRPNSAKKIKSATKQKYPKEFSPESAVRMPKEATIGDQARQVQPHRHGMYDEPQSAGYKGRLHPGLKKQALKDNIRLTKMRGAGSDMRLNVDECHKSSDLVNDDADFFNTNQESEVASNQVNSGNDVQGRDLMFAYDVGDEPEEDDDEMRNTDDDESGEDEEDQDDILIVEGEDEDYEQDSSPEMRKNNKIRDVKPRAISNCASSLKDGGSKGLTPANKSLNASQEGVSTQLYGGDIYLLGGSHFIMSDAMQSEETKGNDFTSDANIAVKFSQASTTTGSEITKPMVRGSSVKKKQAGRRSKKTTIKHIKLQKIQERNSIQEDEGGTEFGDIESTIQNDNINGDLPQSSSQQKQLSQPVNLQTLTEKQRKHALREEFLKRPPNQIVTLIKSPFPSREPYIFFPYPPFLGKQRDLPKDYSKIVQYTQDQLKPYKTPAFKVSESTHTYNCVVNSLKMAGFKHVTGPGWNVIWTGLFKQGRLKNMNQQQHINHFAGSWAIGRKDYMWRNVQRMKRLHGKAFDICPTTYIFPEDYKRWLIDREVSNFKNMYIMKPCASSCGRGIRVIGKTAQVKKRSGYVVSKYVSKPHLIHGYKYDLRLYVLVTGFDPLRIYLFKDGLVRLATVPYTTSKSSLKQRFVHLTNYSVNKKAESYIKNENKSPQKNSGIGQPDAQKEDDDVPKMPIESKLSLQQLREEFKKMDCDFSEVYARIKDVIIKTMLAAEQPILQQVGGSKNKNSCFEIYGFDILIDAKLKPWLLEVNVSPSLSSSSPYDKIVKTKLLSDSLYLIGFNLIDRKMIEQEKAKLTKQRLLGFESQKNNKADLNNIQAHISTNLQSSGAASTPGVKDPSRSLVPKTRQLTGPNQSMKQGVTSFISSDYQVRQEVDAAIQSVTSQNIGSASYSSKSGGSPNRKRTLLSNKLQQPKPFLKDMGDPALQRNKGEPDNRIQSFGCMTNSGYINMSEMDFEILADFEEEQQRKGGFDLLFPTSKTIDEYRGFFSSNRRANLLLWAYIKQGSPMHHLQTQFKYMHQQNQLLQHAQQASSHQPSGHSGTNTAASNN